MGGHKWVPQNRGLNVCTSGYGNTTAVYYDERLDHFSYARYEANEIARAAARELELRAALRDAERAVKEAFLAELFFVDHSAVEEQRLLLPFKLRKLELFPSVSSEALRPSPVILLSWLPAFFAASRWHAAPSLFFSSFWPSSPPLRRWKCLLFRVRRPPCHPNSRGNPV